MPKTRYAVSPVRGAARTKQALKDPTHELTTYTLDGKKKRNYDIIQDVHVGDTKNGFLTFHLRSDVYKARYKTLAQQHGWPFIKHAIEHKEKEPVEDLKREEPKPGISQKEQPSEQYFPSDVYREALQDLNPVGPVHDKAEVPSEKDTPHAGAGVVQYQNEATDVQPTLQQAIGTDPSRQLLNVEKPGLQPASCSDLSPVHPGIAQEKVEGLLSSVNQSLDTASKSALDLFLKESTAKQSSRIPAPAQSELTPAPPETQNQVNPLVATRAQLKEVDSRTKRLHQPLRLVTSQAINTSDSELQGDKQNQHRGLKRSRTPEPPSLTSGAPSAPETPDSPRSRSNSVRPSPARPRGRPPKLKVATSFAPPQKIVTFNTQKLPHGWFLDPTTMAPIHDRSDVSNKIKDVIQNLYDIQSQTHGFVPETQTLLIDKMAELTNSLSDLQRLTDRNISPNNPVQNIDLAPEIVDYVDDGRNPDIFTRDFVELVQRGNAVVNGKKQVFRDFSQVYAKALKEGIGGVDTGVDLVMENAGIEQETGREEGKQNGGKG